MNYPMFIVSNEKEESISIQRVNDKNQWQYSIVFFSRGTKVEKMLTLAPERYTAGFCMVAKVILWCI